MNETIPPSLQAELGFLHWLKVECGYTDPKPIGGGRYAAIRQFMFTHAIVTGRIGDRASMDDRWCYSSYAKAKEAFDAWDGTGEPTGWHRHPATGRRRVDGDPSTEEINW